ncbi:MAG: hypothetical protein JWL59_3728 [Chthoniobacteraceae bacterium]|nr:hypothetical protein [Chthoniobacteraceae bacterium]
MKIRRNWIRLPVKERLAFARNVLEKIENNEHVAAPKPAHPEFKAAFEKAESSERYVDTLKATLKVALVERDSDLDAVMAALEIQASTVESATGGDPAQILTTGYEPSDGIQHPARDMEQVTGLELESGDNAGELDARWARTEGAKSYEVFVSQDPNQAGNWTHRATALRAGITVNGLASGQRSWIRIRAIGTKGAGPWSDAVGKMVP